MVSSNRAEELSWILFPTALGSCGIAWTKQGIKYFHLPEHSSADSKARMQQKTSAPATTHPPAWVAHIIDKVQNHLRGEVQNFADVPLDLTGTSTFYQRVYAAAKNIPPGAVKSYGEIAREINSKGAARAVGQALGKNPIALIVPCHRVIAASQQLGGFSAHGGGRTKKKMLSLEGVKIFH